ncbi:MAG: hypothetical protein IJB79_01820 [Candidatus Gastranaerophilales bacterium]|nr:hypothetical protein [Candidatus Gastranaerophilales bacterium]
MRINNQNNQNFKGLSPLSPALGQFYNANATIPTLIIETGVTLGRAREANKRGGKPEAIDRLVEQGISAVVWIYGVKALKKIGDIIGQKVLNIKDLNFDIGFDELRNPTKYIDKKALGFKAGNILACTAIATYFIGAILPKINNAILDKTLKKQKEAEKSKNKTLNQKRTSFEEFKNNTKKNKEISFTSLSGALINSAHILENNSTARLLITDTGVVAGRFHNAPNKYRKIEGLFRDIASIYFYLKATKHISDGLNSLSKNTAIDPRTLEKTIEMLSKKIKENPELSADDLLEFATSKIDKEKFEQLKELFKKEKTISCEDFIKAFPDLSAKAEEMAKLQYIEEGKGILSFQQASDVLSNSWTSNPKFLKETFDYTTKKDIADKFTFVSSKKLDETRASIDGFIEQIARSAKKENCKISQEFITKIAKKNIGKNLLFNTIGTAISIFALGTLIPKVQYAITKKLTNENKFHTEKE